MRTEKQVCSYFCYFIRMKMQIYIGTQTQFYILKQIILECSIQHGSAGKHGPGAYIYIYCIVGALEIRKACGIFINKPNYILFQRTTNYCLLETIILWSCLREPATFLKFNDLDTSCFFPATLTHKLWETYCFIKL